jgi:putative serine protease PepD
VTEPESWPTPAGSPLYSDGTQIAAPQGGRRPGADGPGRAGAPGDDQQPTQVFEPADAWHPFGDLTQPAPSAPAPVTDGGTRRGGSGRTIMIAVVAGLLAGVIGGYGGAALQDRSTNGTTGVLERLPQSSSEAPPLVPGSVAAVADEVLPTVVSFTVTDSRGEATGSGFVLREDGYLITNNHVISGGADGGRILVTFNDGETAKGSIVGRSKSYDLGVVEVDRKNLPVAPLGNSSAVRVGDPVIAIGSPLGLNGTVTTGIVSSLNRPVTAGGQGDQSFISALQTDAAINPGNSGGPLIDSSGKVIGINSAIATVATGQSEAGSIGLGFAIPINQAKRIAEEIIATGESDTPVIGVSLDTRFDGPGAKVGEVTAGGPASDTDLQAGDVIVAVDGKPIADATELIVAIRAHAPGDEVVLKVKDKGEVRITLGTSPDN